jgi:hypothetical protein
MIVVKGHYVILVLVVKKGGGGGTTINGLLFINNKWDWEGGEWRSNLLVVDFQFFIYPFPSKLIVEHGFVTTKKGFYNFFGTFQAV